VDLAELLRIEGVEEHCDLRSTVGFMALHGGSQDRGTDQIARRAAALSGASYYAIVQPPRLRLHLTSRLHDPAQSAVFSRFLAHVRVAISVHGFGRDSFALWVDPTRGLMIEPYGPARRNNQQHALTGIIVGGLNAALVGQARTLLSTHLPGFHVADERIRLGYHQRNPVNLPPEQGVQIELAPGLRGIGAWGEHLTPEQDAVPSGLIRALVELAQAAALTGAGAGAVPP
jgi:phage replication-related protein YjqB (UPF0714/DUF867 family)